MKRTIAIAALFLTLPLGVRAQQNSDWEFSLGASYRSLDDVEFEGLTLTRPGGSALVNGAHTDGRNYLIEGAPQLDLAGWQAAGPGVFTRNAYFDRATLAADSEGLDDAYGLTMGAKTGFGDLEWLDLEFGLGLFSADTSVDGVGVNITTLTGILTHNVDPGAGVPNTPYEEVGDVVVQGGPANLDMTNNLFDLGGPATTNVAVDFDTETGMAVMSFGASASYRSEPFALSLGVGPTVSVVDAETELNQRATWNAPGDPLDGQAIAGFAKEDSDSSTTVHAGVYLSLSAAYYFTEQLGLELRYRYDKVFNEVETDHAEFDLDGQSGEVRIVFRF